MTATGALGLLVLIAASCAISALASRHRLPAPILLVLAGLAGSFLPGATEFRLNPTFVLIGVLPPLVYSAALERSFLSLRDNIRTLALLSVGLVLFTVVAVAATTAAAVPGVSLAVALTLGAIVAPTDAVTVASIGRRLRLPARLLTVISGESMVNDGTGLTAYQVAIGAAAGAGLSVLAVSGSFLVIAAGGVAVGLALAVTVQALRQRLKDPLAESAASLLVPFAAYLIADAIGVSGVLAVVVAALYLGHHAGHSHFATRLQDMAVWRVTVFVLEAVTFALIGLQLRPVLHQLGHRDPGRLAAEAALVLGAVIVSRIAWVFPAIYLPRLSRRIRDRDPSPPWQVTVVLSWAGMRGVISLVAAFALPVSFPQRDLLQFLTFCVVLGTLLVQGLTLPALIQRLGVITGPDEEIAAARTEAVAQQAASEAGLRRLEELARQPGPGGGLPDPQVVDRLRRLSALQQYAAWERLPAGAPGGGHHRSGSGSGAGQGGHNPPSATFRRLRQEMTAAERVAFISLRDQRAISDQVLDRVLRDLDLEEAILSRETWEE